MTWQTAGVVAIGVLASIGLSLVIAVPVCALIVRGKERSRAEEREAERVYAIQRLGGL